MRIQKAKGSFEITIMRTKFNYIFCRISTKFKKFEIKITTRTYMSEVKILLFFLRCRKWTLLNNWIFSGKKLIYHKVRSRTRHETRMFWNIFSRRHSIEYQTFSNDLCITLPRYVSLYLLPAVWNSTPAYVFHENQSFYNSY